MTLQFEWIKLAEPAALWSLIAVPFILLSISRMLKGYGIRSNLPFIACLCIATVLVAVCPAQPLYVQSFERIEKVPHNFVIALDNSGSMSACFDNRDCTDNTMFDIARTQLLKLAKSRASDNFALTLFNERAIVINKLSEGTAIMLEKLREEKAGVNMTNTVTGLLEGLRQIEDVPEKSRVLVVVTDGEDHFRHGDAEFLKVRLSSVNSRIYWVNLNSGESQINAPAESDIIKLMRDYGARIFKVDNRQESAEAFAEINRLEAQTLTKPVYKIVMMNLTNHFLLAAWLLFLLSVPLAVVWEALKIRFTHMD